MFVIRAPETRNPKPLMFAIRAPETRNPEPETI
jgi:hypothetical protein